MAQTSTVSIPRAYGGGSSSADKRRVLRELLADDQLHVAPTSYDALTATIVEEQGFPALHFSGFYASAAVGGVPDIGLLSLGEMVTSCRNVCMRSGLPVIADADDGYGGPLQVFRTVREYESVGVAGIHIEDQVAPKRCGLMAGKKVISPEAMCEKIAAACEARTDQNLVIIGRTDARQPEGLDAAIKRANMYMDAGADMALVEEPQSVEEIKTVLNEVPGPHLGSWSAFGVTGSLSRSDLAELGYAIVFFVDGPLAIHRAYTRVHEILREDQETRKLQGLMTTYEAMNESMALADWRSLEKDQ